MHMHLSLLVELLFAVALVAMFARRFNFPYTTALVVTGLALGHFKVLPDVELPSSVIINLFLPILLFEAAINTDASHLREEIKPVAVLSTVGFLVMAGITGALLHAFLGLDWPVALLAGTMFSITDTVAVLAVFKSLKVPPRLATIVEGESLFNDGTALVLFKVILAVVLTGVFHPVAAGAEIAFVAVGGFALGGLAGLVGSWVLAKCQDHLTEILMTTLLALSAYYFAEQVHVSGVIAVVVAGLVVGNIGWKRALAPTSQIAVGAFWEYAAFGVNTVVFLMVGLSIDLARLAGTMPAIALSYLAIHIGRLALIYGRFWLLGRVDERPLPAKWQHLMVWGNIKGSLTMVLALSLPDAVPNRDGLLTVTFGVVLMSLLVQGLSLGPVVKAFRVTGVSSLKRRFEAEQVTLIRGRAAQAEIEALLAAGALSKTAYERLKARYQVSIARAERQLRALGTENQSYWDSAFDEVQRRLLLVEKAAVVRASREKLISEETSEEALVDIDTRLVEARVEAETPTREAEAG